MNDMVHTWWIFSQKTGYAFGKVLHTWQDACSYNNQFKSVIGACSYNNQFKSVISLVKPTVYQELMEHSYYGGKEWRSKPISAISWYRARHIAPWGLLTRTQVRWNVLAIYRNLDTPPFIASLNKFSSKLSFASHVPGCTFIHLRAVNAATIMQSCN